MSAVQVHGSLPTRVGGTKGRRGGRYGGQMIRIRRRFLTYQELRQMAMRPAGLSVGRRLTVARRPRLRPGFGPIAKENATFAQDCSDLNLENPFGRRGDTSDDETTFRGLLRRCRVLFRLRGTPVCQRLGPHHRATGGRPRRGGQPAAGTARVARPKAAAYERG